MNKQQVFDKVVTHLYSQGRQSVRVNDTVFGTEVQCMYRGDDGLSCAVGCLIKDEHYSSDLEHIGVVSCYEGLKPVLGTAIIRNALISSDVDLEEDDMIGLLVALQMTHDKCPTNNDGTFKLKQLKSKLMWVLEKFPELDNSIIETMHKRSSV